MARRRNRFPGFDHGKFHFIQFMQQIIREIARRFVNFIDQQDARRASCPSRLEGGPQRAVLCSCACLGVGLD